MEDLLKPENKEKLVKILTYHVVPGKVMAADIVKLSKAKTVEGSEAKITVEERQSDDRQRRRREDRNSGLQWRDPRH